MNRNILITPMQSCHSLNQLPTFARSSTHAFLNYRRKVHNRLAVINNNVSDMIKESCSNIDQICNRVRECLCEMDFLERQRNIMILETLPEYEIEEVKSVEETTQEQDDTTDLSVIENLNDEDDSNLEKIEEQKPNDIVSITPFFSVIKKDINDLELNESYQKQFLIKNKIRPHSSDGTLRNNAEKRDSIFEMFKQNISDTSEMDDFFLLDKLVNNINQEIINFSQTTLNMTENFEKSDSKPATPNANLTKQKSIKRLPRSNSKQKGIQVNDTFSENELEFIMSNKQQSKSLIMPDVYHKRATTDLYKKLVAQVEANDSFIFFQKLMNRRNKQKNEKNTGKLKCSKTKLVLDIPMMQYSYPKKSGSNTSSNTSTRKLSLKEKYADSLWFSQKNMIKEKREIKKKKASSRTASERSFRNKIQTTLSNKTESQRSVRSISNKNTKFERQNPKRRSAICLPSSKNNLKVTQNSLSSLKSYRCHTDCSCKMIVKNNEPPSPASKCRLHWMKAKVDQRCHRKLEFLDILDDLTTRDLLPLRSEYPRKDIQPIIPEENKNVHETYLYKLMYGKQNTQNTWKHLLEPSITCSEKNCKKCESKADRNSNAKKKNDDKKEDLKRKYSKNEVVKTLLPYMHDPNTSPKYCHSVTVMPVHVFYDKHKITEASANFSNYKNLPSIPKKLPLLPMKEAKCCKRAEWVSPGIPKPIKVVYDSLPKKLDTASTTLAKPLANSARGVHEEKIVMKKSTSKSFSPKGFGSFCQKPAGSINPLQVRSPKKEIIETKNRLAKFSNIQSDLQKINEQFQKRNLTNNERKIWANKYGKSVGQQLVSYIDKQEPQKQSPVPKYAKPQSTSQPSPTDSRKSSNSMGSRNRQRQMLAHLQNLKQKNSTIQNNIQKAISVIESKMVDILSSPADTTSIEAFDVMEKEITNVLSMMKCNNKRTPKSRNRENTDTKTDSSLEEDVNNISDELFKKLQRILDSEKSTSHSETDSSKVTPTKEDKRKQKSTSSKIKENESKFQSSSITTTSLEENMIITSCSPHKKVKKIKQNSELKKTSLQLSAVMPSTNLADEVSKDNWDKVTLMPSGDHLCVEKKFANENLLDSKVNESTIKLLLDQDKIMTNVDDDFIPNSEGDMAKPPNILNISENLIYNVKVDVKNDDMNFPEKLAIKETKENKDCDSSKSEENIKTSKSNEVNSEESFSVESNKETEVPLTEETDNILQIEAEATKNNDCSIEHTESLGYSTEENQICTYNQTSIMGSPKVIEMEREDSSASFSEHVNRIIKRVEHIYTQLDDIQSTESNDNIPRFKDILDTVDVRSEIFLTPFMQAVKEKRRSLDPVKKSIIEKSPSYYNVITFLDTLSDIQEEKTVEIQIARLCYINVYRQSTVFHQAEILHLAEIMPGFVEKPSCLKKNSDTKSKQKKVSFLVSKSDKSDQVNFCPIHKLKTKKTSSEQFPPLEPIELELTIHPNDKSVGIETPDIDFSTTTKENCDKNVTICNTQNISNVSSQNCFQSDDSEDTILDPNHFENEIINDKIDIHDTTEVDAETTNELQEVTENKSNETFYEIDPDENINDTTYTITKNSLECVHICKSSMKKSEEKIEEPLPKNEQSPTVSYETIVKPDLSEVDDKSTQVFCQMQKEDTFEEITTEYTPTISNDETICEKVINLPKTYSEDESDNMNLSKSSENETFAGTTQINIFYDHSDENIVPKVTEKTLKKVYNGIYGEETILKVKNSLHNMKQPKIVVFREIPEVTNLLKPLEHIEKFVDTKTFQKRLEKRRQLKLIRKASVELIKKKIPVNIQTDEENVILLKSFYAIVYILMFTALSLDYKCI